MARPLKAIVYPEAIARNLELFRRLQPGRKLAAILKANGYGHGMQTAARAAQTAEAFAVSCVEEALELRDIFPEKPIFLLEGFFEDAELELVERHRLWPVLHSAEQLEQLKSYRPTERISVWLKVDTGMNRLGFRVSDVPRLVELARTSLPGVSIRGIASHLASADDPQAPQTAWQYKQLADLAQEGLDLSISNSAGILSKSALSGEWMRPGISLYGASPLRGRTAEELELRPAMTLETALIGVRMCHRGDLVGYGGTWECPEDMPVGVVAAGYGDGYPRHAAPGTRVLVNGHSASLVGRVCMDMFMVDLRNCPGVGIGNRVVLWGDGLPVEEVAAGAGTIANEVLSGVTSRVPRVVA